MGLAGSRIAGDRSPDQWQVSVTPCLSAVGLDGDETIRDRAAAVDANFIEFVEEADSIFAYLSVFEARKGKRGIFVAPVYMRVGMEGDVEIGPLTIDADVTSEIGIVEFGTS